jgi:Ca2+-binding RTX toxin-like protein
MSHATIEPLGARRMLAATPHAKAEPAAAAAGVTVQTTLKGDAAGQVNFADLVTLATNYNNNAWMTGDPTVTFADLVLLAQNYNKTTLPAGATLGKNGKLTVTMDSFNSAYISVRKNTTSVSLNHVSRHGEGWTADIFQASFKGVRSIDITGSDFDDSIRLSDGVRVTTVHAGAGNDTITGSNGDSALYGGDGSDRFYGGGGNDSLFGEAGDDRLNGDTGNDFLDGGAGKDRLDGGKGRNRLAGGSGTDYLAVHTGKDKTDRDVKDRLTELA